MGYFGEGGLEALHPLDKRARVLVRSMRNAQMRHEAMAVHESVQQNFNPKPKEKPKRTQKARIPPAPVPANGQAADAPVGMTGSD